MKDSTFQEFKTLLSNLMRARFPFLYIPTWEEERALSVIRTVAANESLIKTIRKVFIWSATHGMAEDGQRGKEDSKAPLKCLEFIESYDQPAVFILKRQIKHTCS